MMRFLFLNFLFIFSVFCLGQTSTKQASNIKFTFVGCNEFIATWTNGDKTHRIVFVNEGSPTKDVPTYNEFYTSDSIFGKGETFNGNKTHFCVYNGKGNSVRVTGLKQSTKYSLAVFEYNGGGGIYDYKIDSFPVKDTVTKNIVANFSVFPTHQCLRGNSSQFTNTSYSDLSPISFIWNFEDGDTSGIKTPKHIYKNPGIRHVKLIAIAPGCYTSIVVNDTILEHPVAKFDLDPIYLPRNKDEQCVLNNKFIFRNQTTFINTGGNPLTYYKWYIEPDTKPFISGYKSDIIFNTPGTKKIKLVSTTIYGCGDSMYRTYTVNKGGINFSKVNISQKTMYLKNNNFTFTNYSQGFIKNKWYLRKKNESTYFDSIFGKNVIYSFKEAGWYYVSTSNDSASDCIDSYIELIEVKNNPGNLSETKIQAISIYPNPSKSGIFLINNLPVDASLTVYDIIGKELLNRNPQQTNSEINLSHFGAGTYILSVWSEGSKFDYRLVVL